MTARNMPMTRSGFRFESGLYFDENDGSYLLIHNFRDLDVMVFEWDFKIGVDEHFFVLDRDLHLYDFFFFRTVDIEHSFCAHSTGSVLCKVNVLYDLALESGFWIFHRFHVILAEMFFLQAAVESVERIYINGKCNVFGSA